MFCCNSDHKNKMQMQTSVVQTDTSSMETYVTTRLLGSVLLMKNEGRLQMPLVSHFMKDRFWQLIQNIFCIAMVLPTVGLLQPSSCSVTSSESLFKSEDKVSVQVWRMQSLSSAFRPSPEPSVSSGGDHPMIPEHPVCSGIIG